MEARVNELIHKHTIRLSNEKSIARMKDAICEAYDLGKEQASCLAARWHDINTEKPPIGVMVIGRKIGKWTNLIIRDVEPENRKMNDIYHGVNDYQNWMPDLWFPLPV